MFSIIIPTFNNLNYLKLCISSIKKNSKYNHQIIPHINIGKLDSDVKSELERSLRTVSGIVEEADKVKGAIRKGLEADHYSRVSK